MGNDPEKDHNPAPAPAVIMNVAQVSGGLVAGVVHGPIHVGQAAPRTAGVPSEPREPTLAGQPARAVEVAPITPSSPRPSASSSAAHSKIDLASRVTIGIITALPKELAAMKVMLDNPVKHGVAGTGAGRQYWLGEAPAARGGTHAVAVAQCHMGNNQAAARATLLLEHFPGIDALLMVGIAGAVPHPQKPSEHVRLGDIVVSDRLGVLQYDFIKDTDKVVEHRHSPRPPSARLLEADSALHLLQEEGERPWEAFFARASTLPRSARPSVADLLYDPDDPLKSIDHPEDPDRQEGLPRVFRGPIASANALLKSAKRRELLREALGVRAVEMEGSGIADATWLHEKGYFVVRGTCDYCDAHKSDAWQVYAAVVAAAYTRALLGVMRATA